MQELYSDKNHFNNELYFTLCNTMKEGTAIMEVISKQFVYCNKSFLKMFELTSLNEIDITLYRKLRKEMLTAAAIAEREKVIKEKGFFSELVEYTSINGHSFFGEVTIRYYKNKGTEYYLVVVNPVEKSFFELASVGILMVNKNGEMVTANPFILKQFGYSQSEIIGKKIELLIPARFHEKHVGYRQKFFHNSQDRPLGAGMELFGIKKDGTEFSVEVSLGHYPSDGDQYVIAFINDISVRKKAERELKKINDELEIMVQLRTKDLMETLNQLELSRNELQRGITFQNTLLDNVGAIIITVDQDGIIQTFNPEAEKELGYKAAEVIGRHTPLIFHEPSLVKERASSLSAELQKEIAPTMELFYTMTSKGMHNENEWVYVRKDGTMFPVQLNVSAMKNKDGSILGYVGVAFNISETKKIEQELQQALENEKELSELKSRFVSMASHEFRTPLSTVLSSAYLIEKYNSAADQPKREVHLQRIISSVSMLTDILNDFLSVGKIEEGKIQVRPAHFNIRELILTTTAGMESTLKNKQTIRYHHEGKTEVFLDPSLLKHIIMNLTSNASKFSPETGLIEIKSCSKENKILLSVKDQGIGISKEDQQHLMERFFRGSNAGNIQGTGLGLHIVSKYTELMNGSVKCRSELDKGTEFIVTFNTKKMLI